MSPASTSTSSSSFPAKPANLALVYAKLVLVALFWGGTFIAGRIIAPVMPLMTAATGRFMVAALILLAVAWKIEGGLPRLDKSQLLTTAALGLCGIFLYNVCFFAALAHMPAGRTALFVALNPIVTAMALGMLFRERLRPVKWIGIGIAFLGTAIVITRGDPASALHDISKSVGIGEILMFCGISSWAAYTIIGRFVLKNLTPIAATTYATLWGLAFLLVGAAFEFSSVAWSSFGWQIWASIVYLGAVGTALGFIWYYEGVKAIGPSRTSVFTNLVPVFAVLLASILLAEPILISMIAGGALVIIGVTLTNR